MSILQILRNAWKIEDLRKKILFTAFIILIFRIGACLPVPFINADTLAGFYNSQGTILGYMNMLSGNALASGTVFALTIQPYINASIIIQLLTIAIPALERLSKDGGEEGKKKINAITRYSTVGIGAIMSIGYIVTLNSSNALVAFDNKFYTFMEYAVIFIVLLAGTYLVMWLGESIDEKGIGNGISIILFASIVSRGASIITQLIYQCKMGRWYLVPIVIVMALVIFAFIVYMDSSERRIPIQYAKRQVGRRLYGGQSTHLPIKVVMTGVMPIIFAYAIVGIPATIAQFCKQDSGYFLWVKNHFSQTSPLYIIVTFVLIIAFNYFYLAIQYNPVEIANNIQKNGGSIPGIRQGRPTSDFIQRVVNRVTLAGALFLGVIAIFPYIIQIIYQACSGASDFNIALGGTSMMIVVSVALETVKMIEAQMMMRHYQGFMD